MTRALGIVTGSSKNTWVEGLETYRIVGSFSFLGRYRTVDFPVSNMSNSGIDRIQVYVRRKPRSITEHLGTGRQYSINSKRGILKVLFSENQSERDIYNTDMAAFADNVESIQKENCSHVVIAPDFMIYTADYDALLEKHIASNADISILYHTVEDARDAYHNCDIVRLNRQNGVLALDRNRGNETVCNISMDTYIMTKELFLDLIAESRRISSLYTLSDIINVKCSELDIRGIAHKGYFAAITDFKSYYEANMSLIDYQTALTLFDAERPIYTRTNDSCPTTFSETSDVKASVVSNGCLIEGAVENSIIGRGCVIKKGCVIKNSIILPDVYVSEDTMIEHMVIDKHAKIIHAKELIADADAPGYVKRGDTL